ncbi:hypothetical protein LOAG_02107 [Loa loa]|uniref:Uncharacterized protein n=1 Tax=Loa loa TaxID=7209 RepID=A0A1S0U9E1_LOALO|nr:hypothetical protein LOAG_02107 [Loa loa]EFO26374.1 hypothetical protein LOAG_02107 [Loa loa]
MYGSRKSFSEYPLHFLINARKKDSHKGNLNTSKCMKILLLSSFAAYSNFHPFEVCTEQIVIMKPLSENVDILKCHSKGIDENLEIPISNVQSADDQETVFRNINPCSFLPAFHPLTSFFISGNELPEFCFKIFGGPVEMKRWAIYNVIILEKKSCQRI